MCIYIYITTLVPLRPSTLILYIYIYIYIYTHIYVHIYIYTFLYVFIYLLIYLFICMYFPRESGDLPPPSAGRVRRPALFIIIIIIYIKDHIPYIPYILYYACLRRWVRRPALFMQPPYVYIYIYIERERDYSRYIYIYIYYRVWGLGCMFMHVVYCACCTLFIHACMHIHAAP